MILDPDIVSRFSDCGVAVFDEPTEFIPVVLAYLKMRLENPDKQSIDIAERHLYRLRSVIKFAKNDVFASNLADGKTCITYGFAGDIVQAQEKAKDRRRIIFISPTERKFLWYDMMAIPTDAHNTKGAYKFINAMLDPRTIARISNHVKYANANKASLPHLNKTIANDPAIVPTSQVVNDAVEPLPRSDANLKQMKAVWERVRRGEAPPELPQVQAPKPSPPVNRPQAPAQPSTTTRATQTAVAAVPVGKSNGAKDPKCDISGRSLAGKKLDGCILTAADLRGVLAAADLRGASLVNANLTGANLSSADLTNADLSGANLTGANLTAAKIGNAKLNAAIADKAIMRGADLSGADFSGARLTKADLRAAKVTGTKWEGASVVGAIFLSVKELDCGNFRAALNHEEAEWDASMCK